MGNTWVINMLHSLDEDGNLARQSSPARRMAEYFGSIVESVTARPASEQDWVIPVPCRRRPHRKLCLGMIAAGYSKDDSTTIVWQCSACDDNGYISGWQETQWDKRRF